MKRLSLVVFLLIMFSLLFISGCANQQIGSNSNNNPNIADPASVYCINSGYKTEITSNSEGQEVFCIFPNNSRCDEWKFFQGECGQEYTFCNIHGGELILTNQGCQFSQNCTICKLASGKECDEFSYSKGDCS
jgi:uncharacterized protein